MSCGCSDITQNIVITNNTPVHPNIDCGSSISDQRVVFGSPSGIAGAIDCKSVKIVKGSEVKASLPLDITIPSDSYSTTEITLPKNGTPLTLTQIKTETLRFMAFTVKYPGSTKPELQQQIFWGHQFDITNNIFRSMRNVLILTFGDTTQESIYLYNPMDTDVKVSILKSN